MKRATDNPALCLSPVSRAEARAVGIESALIKIDHAAGEAGIVHREGVVAARGHVEC